MIKEKKKAVEALLAQAQAHTHTPTSMIPLTPPSTSSPPALQNESDFDKKKQTSNQ